MEFEFEVDGELHKVVIEAKGDSLQVTVGGETRELAAKRTSQNSLLLASDAGCRRVYVAQQREKKYVFIGGRQVCLKASDQKRAGQAGVLLETSKSVTSEMPGTVVKLLVCEGEEVKRNQAVIIVEAMKMENQLGSPIDSKVKKLNCKAGDLINAGDVLIELE